MIIFIASKKLFIVSLRPYEQYARIIYLNHHTFNYVSKIALFCYNQAWSILRNRHRKQIRIDLKSVRFRLELIWHEIWKSQIITKNFNSILDFIYACFKINRCYLILSKYNHIILTNRWKLWNNCFVTDFIFIYRFLTDLTWISIINSYETHTYIKI